jgi:type II secretory pathway pseudopilin PulG
MKRLNHKHGITVLEMTIGIGILALIFSAAFPLVDAMISRFQMARDHYVAASLCQGRIERARGVPYSDIASMAENGVTIDDFGNTHPDGRFRRTTVVRPDTPTAGLTTMMVRTQICICSRRGWRKAFHPVKTGKRICEFTDECEQMSFIFTEYKQ